MGFSNKTMREPVPGKPHIAKRQGYWRVSSWKPGTGSLYYEAHRAIRLWNVDTTRTVHGIFIKQPGVANSHYRSWDYCPYDTTKQEPEEEPKVEDFVGEKPSPISGEYKPWFRPDQLVCDDPAPERRFDRDKLLKHVASYQMGPEKLRSLMDAELEKARQEWLKRHPIFMGVCPPEDKSDENED